MSTEPTLEPCAKFEPWIPAELVVRDPWVCAGEPTMRGTRILAETIVAELAIGTTWETLKSMYPTLPVPASQPGRGDADTPDLYTETGTGGLNRHRDAQGHWLKFNNGEIVGCQCGVRADMDSDCGWGDSVVAHLVDVGAEAARPAHYLEVATSLDRLGHRDAARAVRSAAKDLEDRE
jgi:hypothetical protein